MCDFPGIARIGDGSWRLGREIELPIRLDSIRAIFVTWSQFAFDGVHNYSRREAFDALATPLAKLDEALPGFYERNVISSDYAVAAWQDATEAARRGVSNVSPRRISIMRRLLALHPCVGDDKCSRR